MTEQTDWAPECYRNDEVKLRNTAQKTSDGHVVCLATVDRQIDDPRGVPGLHTLLVVDGKVCKEYELLDANENSLLRRAFRNAINASKPAPLELVIMELDNMYAGLDYREEQK